MNLWVSSGSKLTRYKLEMKQKKIEKNSIYDIPNLRSSGQRTHLLCELQYISLQSMFGFRAMSYYGPSGSGLEMMMDGRQAYFDVYEKIKPVDLYTVYWGDYLSHAVASSVSTDENNPTKYLRLYDSFDNYENLITDAPTSSLAFLDGYGVGLLLAAPNVSSSEEILVFDRKDFQHEY